VNHKAIIISLGVLYEMFAILMIRRLWTKRRDIGLVERSVLTIVLLLPFVGVLFYAFLKPSPEPHGDNPPEHTENA
jgi:hypothetical protein